MPSYSWYGLHSLVWFEPGVQDLHQGTSQRKFHWQPYQKWGWLLEGSSQASGRGPRQTPSDAHSLSSGKAHQSDLSKKIIKYKVNFKFWGLMLQVCL